MSNQRYLKKKFKDLTVIKFLNKHLPKKLKVSSVGKRKYYKNGYNLTHFGIIILNTDDTWGCFVFLDEKEHSKKILKEIIDQVISKYENKDETITQELMSSEYVILDRIICAPILQAVHGNELNDLLDPCDIYNLDRVLGGKYLPIWK